MEQYNHLLLACLRQKCDPALISGQMKLMNDSDWAFFSQSITQQGITSLIYHRLKKNSLTDLLPPELCSSLHHCYLLNTAIVVRLTNAYFQIQKAFANARIEVIALKGVHLANSVYQQPGERQMCDLDILVPRKDLYRASRILIEIGFTTEKELTESELTDDMEKHLPLFRSPDRSLFIELHWNIVNKENNLVVDMEILWEKSTTLLVNDLTMNVLSPADLLLHLCIHSIFSHQLEITIKTLCDISLLIEKYSDQWSYDDIIITAKKWGMGNSLFLILKLVNNLLSTPIPDNIASTISTKKMELMTQLAIDTIFDTKNTIYSDKTETAQLPYSRPLLKKYKKIISYLFPSLQKTLRIHSLPINTNPVIAYGIHHGKFIKTKANKIKTFLLFYSPRNKTKIKKYKRQKILMNWISE